MVQLILEAAQGASAGLYPDTFRQTERCDLPEGAHRIGTDGFVAGAAFAALARASAQPSTAALLTPKNPFCHCIILILKWYKMASDQQRGHSLAVKPQPSKLVSPVRFRVPAPRPGRLRWSGLAPRGLQEEMPEFPFFNVYLSLRILRSLVATAVSLAVLRRNLQLDVSQTNLQLRRFFFSLTLGVDSISARCL